jgi:hypothetical protein
VNIHTLLVHLYLKIATIKINKKITNMTLKTAKKKIVIKIPAFQTIEQKLYIKTKAITR